MLKKNDVVIIESTIPVGTTKKIATILEKRTELIAGEDFYLAHSPERVLPGKIFYEIVHNDRLLSVVSMPHLRKNKNFI